MSTGGSGAVFFLGTRAHYQVLQRPENRFDLDNGNESTESIYQNRSAQELWPEGKMKDSDNKNRVKECNWSYENEVNVSDEKLREENTGNGIISRTIRRESETASCEKDNDIKPALLNIDPDSASSPKPRRRRHFLSLLSSLTRRKRRHDADETQYLRHIESALMTCTYKESCRCLDCQSRYFECDESEDYSSDDSDYYPQQILPPAPQPMQQEEDDEVFVDTAPSDNTSTDMLLEKEKASISSEEVDESEEDNMHLEVAAGTPILLNYLLTHPITCAIQ
ncbi:uncharacterized protein LOC101741935 [Bombyx mori]|uniref:DUF4802 domain-containing protein n=1 Tax=Bombyx mori TaxID=7091 RepID=A0A8R2HRV2_BOMMO|nr:uncharacterized protein LOC101741935 [Bombyx mori]XP_021208331.1 uncharacterized protein LOC101741935 [Bombyx mori]